MLRVLEVSSNQKLFLYAVASRFAWMAWVVALAAVVPDDDESLALNGVDLRSSDPSGVGTRPEPSLLLSPLWVWDAAHFRYVADYGYTHQTTTAFYPFVPLLMRWLQQLVPGAPFAAFCVLQVVAFAGSAVALRACLRGVGKYGVDRIMCRALVHQTPVNQPMGSDGRTKPGFIVGLALVLYLGSPASVFTVAAYTEPLFAAFTLAAMALVASEPPPRWDSFRAVLARSARMVVVVGCLGLATTVRSNGIVALPVLAHIACLRVGRIASSGTGGSRWMKGCRVGGEALWWGAWVGMAGCVVLVPYVATNLVACRAYCPAARWPELSFSAVVPTSLRATAAVRGADAMLGWVGPEVPPQAPDPSLCPSIGWDMYGLVQARYWGVGWFTYFKWSNLHHFAIASPLFVSVLWALWVVVVRPLGILGGFVAVLESPFVALLGVLMTLGLTKFHVHVTTRLVLYCPSLYALLASGIVSSAPLAWFVTMYYGAFAALGPGLFPNFYPWT